MIDANVFLTMYGTNNDSGERQLKDSDNRNKFERKQVRRLFNILKKISKIEQSYFALG